MNIPNYKCSLLKNTYSILTFSHCQRHLKMTDIPRFEWVNPLTPGYASVSNISFRGSIPPKKQRITELQIWMFDIDFFFTDIVQLLISDTDINGYTDMCGLCKDYCDYGKLTFHKRR